jgi:hypothetical protein
MIDFYLNFIKSYSIYLLYFFMLLFYISQYLFSFIFSTYYNQIKIDLFIKIFNLKIENQLNIFFN